MSFATAETLLTTTIGNAGSFLYNVIDAYVPVVLGVVAIFAVVGWLRGLIRRRR